MGLKALVSWDCWGPRSRHLTTDLPGAGPGARCPHSGACALPELHCGCFFPGALALSRCSEPPDPWPASAGRRLWAKSRKHPSCPAWVHVWCSHHGHKGQRSESPAGLILSPGFSKCEKDTTHLCLDLSHCHVDHDDSPPPRLLLPMAPTAGLAGLPALHLGPWPTLPLECELLRTPWLPAAA